MGVPRSRYLRALSWPARRIREGYRLSDGPSLGWACLRGQTLEQWEEARNGRETAAEAAVVHSAPRTVYLEITARCPVNCLMCARRYRQGRQYGDLSESAFARLAKVLPRVGLTVIGGFGEPLSAPSFDSYFDRLTALGARVAIQTSGYALTEQRVERLFAGGLRHLHVSMDAAEQETYEQIRPRLSLAEVSARVRHMADLKRRAGSVFPSLQVVFVAMRRNIEQLPRMVDLAADLGADMLSVRYVAIHGEELRPESLFYHQDLALRSFDEAEGRAQERGLALDLPPRFGAAAAGEPASRRCTDPWQVAWIDWKGDVRPCCYMPGTTSIRSLAEESFESIWNGPGYQELRRTVNSASPPEGCLKCLAGRVRGVDDERAHVMLK